MSTNHHFSAKIQRWYSIHKRDLPWRHDNDPYRIWLSEVILQQTRVVYGESYFKRFTSTFPTIHDLANAPENQVLKLWQGLGYYSRARNLHKTAKLITNEFEGVFPNTYTELLALPGVGPYTAAAISSICFHLPHAVVDGNVYRVLARYFGMEDPIDTGQAKKRFEVLANELLDVKQPGNYNQAIMEFGALQCKPKTPVCDLCILKNSCVALEKNKVNDFPFKQASKPVRKRYFNYLVPMLPNHQTALIQRKGKDIWQHLYEFPLFESTRTLTAENISKESNLPDWVSADEVSLFNPKPWVHQLTHQRIYASFWIVPTDFIPSTPISISKLANYPVSRLIERFLHKFFD
ncbi:MAG: A/G-specific adenine glycosylase [Flavobacteriaceae bacterium]|nr:A/G-specific adenine glycosylase [Flavobacteriaceae bacterium]